MIVELCLDLKNNSHPLEMKPKTSGEDVIIARICCEIIQWWEWRGRDKDEIRVVMRCSLYKVPCSLCPSHACAKFSMGEGKDGRGRGREKVGGEILQTMPCISQSKSPARWMVSAALLQEITSLARESLRGERPCALCHFTVLLGPNPHKGLLYQNA